MAKIICPNCHEIVELRITENKVEALGRPKKKETFHSGNTCPDCGSMLIHEEGCERCVTCGFSKC